MPQTTNIAPLDLDSINHKLADTPATDIVRWARDQLGDRLILTSSFGAQAAVMLHLVTRVVPDMPILFIDTGFHFQETYAFMHKLAQRLDLNMKVYQSWMSPAHMVAIHGRLWEQGKDGLDKYDRIRKVEPMQRALRELEPRAWFAGLRRTQTDHRAQLRHVELQDHIYKVHPILTWTTTNVHEYLKAHDLPYHPLHDQGYPSIGDWHSTLPVGESDDDRAGRFQGLKQECGIHLPQTEAEDASRFSSGL